MQMDIGKAFTFVGEDPKWVTKVLIGGGMLLLAIVLSITVIGGILVGAIVFGYLVQLTRNVIAGERLPLPEWTNFGELFVDGLKAWVVSFVLALPLIVVSSVVWVPAIIVSAAGGDSDAGAAIGGLLSLVGGCLGFLLGIVFALMLPIAIGRYAATRSIGEGLRLGAIFDTLRANIGTYLLVLLMVFAASLIGQLGILLCFIGLPFTLFYAQVVQYHLYGQAHVKAHGSMPGMGQPQAAFPPPYPY